MTFPLKFYSGKEIFKGGAGYSLASWQEDKPLSFGRKY